MGNTVRVPLSALAKARARPAFGARVAVLAKAYQSGRPPEPIPVCVSPNGAGLRLCRSEGNHRLAAARLAGVSHVEVSCDAEDVPKLVRIAKELS